MASKRSKEPGTSDKRPESQGGGAICFVIMPFGGWLDGYYEAIHKPAIKDSGLEPHRADDLYRPSTIVNDIWTYTKKAKLLLADLTGRNPNVFYELGMAHALGKPVILIAESMDDVPFDLRALRVILYDKNVPDWGKVLRDKIANAIREVVASPISAVLPAFLDVGDKTRPNISERDRELIEIRQEIGSLRQELRSRSDPSDPLGIRRRGSRSEVDIGPEEARKLIERHLQIGLPDEVVVSSIQPLGPPEEWILREIEAMRGRVPPRSKSPAITKVAKKRK